MESGTHKTRNLERVSDINRRNIDATKVITLVTQEVFLLVLYL